MASKKDKCLESAQRFMLKGQLDKAIKEYQQVVALEPQELRYRQKLAELLVRDSRKDEAITQYEDVGKHYAENSYFLKAIAVYKQIQRLAPKDTAISLTLASLNHQQGLIGNALAEYGQVVVQLEKEGALKEAVKVLQQMLLVDGEHAATRLKYAELLSASGEEDASYQAFSSLLSSLRAKGDDSAVQHVSGRMRKLFPGEQENDLDSIAARISAGDLDGAIESLQGCLKRDSGNLQAWQLLCTAELRKGNTAGRRLAFSKMTELFPEDLSVLEGAIGCDIETGDLTGAVSLLELHLPLFQKGAPQVAEQLFLLLPAEDPRVKDGLRRLYEASAGLDKLNALKVSGVLSSQQAVPESSVSDSLVMEIETNSAFGPTSSALAAVAEVPSAFGVPLSPERVDISSEPSRSETPLELSSAWEEEIELDLGDDFHDVARPAASSFEASQDAELPLKFEPPPDVDPPLEVDSYQELDLSLDFSLSLDLDEEELAEVSLAPDTSPMVEIPGSPDDASSETDRSFCLNRAVPFAEAPQETVELDLDEEAILGLMPPEDYRSLAEVGWAEETEELELCDPASAPRQLRGWQEIYPGAVGGADKAIDVDELESHYDLGICYKEMGLYNEAIKSFSVAAGNPQRRLDCLTLQAICYREKGEPAKAEDLLQRGRDLEVLSIEEQMSLNFELAFLLETTGAVEEAIGLYREVYKANPDFHDVARRLYLLSGDECEESLDVIELEMEEDDF